MIAFGAAISEPEVYERIALPSIRRIAEPDSLVLTREGYDSIQQPYNEIMDEAAAHEDLEALVLLHQDLELLDDSLLHRVRPLLGDPRNGVIGLFGAREAPFSIWWEADRLFGRQGSPTSLVHHSVGPDEVEVVDGALLVLAPWVVRTLHFSEAFSADFHGYDQDMCFRVRAAGGRVICNDVPYHHHISRPWRDRAEYMRAANMLSRKWDPVRRPLEWAPAFRV